MNNRTLLLVALFTVGLAGCSSGTTPAPDPFFGRTTIAPPSTVSSTMSGATASSYAPSATVAAPVSSQPSAWQSPPSPNFGENAAVSPRYGSLASSAPSSVTQPLASQPLASQPSRPIYLNQSAIEESVRQPSYTTNNTTTYNAPSRTVAAAGSNRATNAPRTASPLKISPAAGFQAVHGKPVKEENKITYRSADGSIPQYNDPRSSFGQTPDARFKHSGSTTEAPAWSSSNQNSTSLPSNTPSIPSNISTSQLDANHSPERINPMGLGATQPRVSTRTLASNNTSSEKMLPPIRGYSSARNRTSRAQSTSSQVVQNRAARSSSSLSTPYRSSRSTQLASTTLSPAIRRPSSIPTFAPARPGEPTIMPAPPQGVNIADLPDVTRIASRPSDAGTSSGTRRLSYETPATDRSSDTSSPRHDSHVKPVSFNPTVRYSHNEDYSRLRGELDYSEIDQRWKLRYISINEDNTDDYGGSVTLNQTSKLSGFERGDFIEVRGRILSGPKGDWGYARAYEVQEIRQVR